MGALLTITLSTFGFLLILAALFGLLYRKRIWPFAKSPKNIAKEHIIATNLLDFEDQQLLKTPVQAPPPPREPSIDLSTLTVSDLIGRGRYGCVFLANGCLATDQPMAAKIYQADSQEYFLNECSIYELPLMEECPYLLRYFGWREVDVLANQSTLVAWMRMRNGEEESLGRNSENDDAEMFRGDPPSFVKEYWLVTEYIAGGTLQDCLKTTTLNWDEFTRLALSLTTGLAYLHTERRKNGEC